MSRHWRLTLLILAHWTLMLCAGSATADRRVALVIGNSSYQHVPALSNPQNDAADMTLKLQTMGFKVISGEDLNLENMRSKIREFVKILPGVDVALFFYAGHGLQVNGENYLAPIDTQLGSYEDLEFETVSMAIVLSAMERNAKVNLIFLDACRDNPLTDILSRSMGTRSASVGRGLAKIGSGVGTLIAFATQPGNVALDGQGRNSPFTSALLKRLGTPGQSITQDLILVRRDVLASTAGKQVPWDNSSLTDDVYLVPGSASPTTTSPTPVPIAPTAKDQAVELAFWDTVRASDDPLLYQTYIDQYPNGSFVPLARAKLLLLDREKKGSRQVLGPSENSDAEGKDVKLVGIEPTSKAPGAAQGPFDGRWKITRRATNQACGWKSLDSDIMVANGVVKSSEWSGTFRSDGNVSSTLKFIFKGKAERNIAKAKVKGNDGSGRFSHVGGTCAGTISLVKF